MAAVASISRSSATAAVASFRCWCRDPDCIDAWLQRGHDRGPAAVRIYRPLGSFARAWLPRSPLGRGPHGGTWPGAREPVPAAAAISSLRVAGTRAGVGIGWSVVREICDQVRSLGDLRIGYPVAGLFRVLAPVLLRRPGVRAAFGPLACAVGREVAAGAASVRRVGTNAQRVGGRDGCGDLLGTSD